MIFCNVWSHFPWLWCGTALSGEVEKADENIRQLQLPSLVFSLHHCSCISSCSLFSTIAFVISKSDCTNFLLFHSAQRCSYHSGLLPIFTSQSAPTSPDKPGIIIITSDATILWSNWRISRMMMDTLVKTILWGLKVPWADFVRRQVNDGLKLSNKKSSSSSLW